MLRSSRDTNMFAFRLISPTVVIDKGVSVFQVFWNVSWRGALSVRSPITFFQSSQSKLNGKSRCQHNSSIFIGRFEATTNSLIKWYLRFIHWIIGRFIGHASTPTRRRHPFGFSTTLGTTTSCRRFNFPPTTANAGRREQPTTVHCGQHIATPFCRCAFFLFDPTTNNTPSSFQSNFQSNTTTTTT